MRGGNDRLSIPSLYLRVELMTSRIPENIPALTAPADFGRSVRCSFDPTNKRSLRMRRDDGSQAAAETRKQIEDVLATLDALLQPMRVMHLKATLPPVAHRAGPILDVWRLVHLPVFIHAAIASHRDLLGQPVNITANLVIPDNHEASPVFDAELKVGSPTIGPRNAAAESVLRPVSARAGRYWVQAVSNVIGPWAAVSGISELQIGGVFHAGSICSTSVPTAGMDPLTDILRD